MPEIKTLVKDIQQLVTKKDGWFNTDLSRSFADDVALRVAAQFESKKKPTLRLSQMGPRCPRALWHSIHTPELAESLPPWAEVKYTFGHIIEAMAITLAKASGHEVTGEQDAVTVDGILGHRDCVIDGCVVDVKSSSTMGFKKFREGTLEHSDSFGYLEQLDGYLVGSLGDPLVRVKDKGYILAIDKQLGHMVIYEHRIRESHIRERIAASKQIVEMDSPPACGCRTITEDNGNVKLDVSASYSSYKFCCNPSLRTFIYSKGPEYFTKVVKRPSYKGVPLMEIDKFGKVLYN